VRGAEGAKNIILHTTVESQKNVPHTTVENYFFPKLLIGVGGRSRLIIFARKKIK